MRRTLARVVAVLALTGCPGKTPPPIDAVPTRTDAAAVGSVTAAGKGTLAVTVRDERGRPVAGAAVWVQGLKATTPVPTEPIVLEQRGLEFRPSFLVARRGQRLLVRNADQELHNVHSNADCCSWNVSITAGHEDGRVLDTAGEATFLCDIHAHMRASLLVVDADFVLSDALGRARLEGIPSGDRRVFVRAFDRPRAEVAVAAAADQTVAVAVTLEASRAPASTRIVPPEQLPWVTLAVRLHDALDDARARAAQGDGASAREAVDAGLGTWFSASGLYEAIRSFDADRAEKDPARYKDHRDRASWLKSEIGKVARDAEAAAASSPDDRPALLEKLDARVKKLCGNVEEAADELPKREPGKDR